MSPGTETEPSSSKSPAQASRALGISVAVLTAAVVFGVGLVLTEPRPVPAPALLSDGAVPQDGAASDVAAPDAPVLDVRVEVGLPADAVPTSASDASVAQAVPDAPDAGELAATDAGAVDGARAGDRDRAAAEKERAADKADKDIAREAWRRNLPDVSVTGGRAAILIPIKGSLEGASYSMNARSVAISLPNARSLITMEFYSIKRDGFRNLWIKEGGSSIRLTLGAEAGEPQVELKDDFVRIAIRRPAAQEERR